MNVDLNIIATIFHYVDYPATDAYTKELIKRSGLLSRFSAELPIVASW